jgi:cytidylate kinase
MAIVTISHEMGSGGAEIGLTVAHRLGYRHVDHEVILDHARPYGVVEEKLSHLEESKPSLFERFDVETRRYITVIQTLLYEFAGDDNTVLMGRGGQWLLQGIPHVLRVRVIAPFDLRVKRHAERLTMQAGERVHPRTATQAVRRDDADKSSRMRYLCDVDLNDPRLYDVMLNTERLTFDAAVALLIDLVGQPELVTTEAGKQVVSDRELASKVEVALATHPKTRKSRITVEARQGVVTLEGPTSVDQAGQVAGGVPGVREVQIRRRAVPAVSPFMA